MDSQMNNNLDLTTPVQFVKGVGPARAKTFQKLGIETLAELLEYYPRDYVFMPSPIKIDRLKPDQRANAISSQPRVRDRHPERL